MYTILKYTNFRALVVIYTNLKQNEIQGCSGNVQEPEIYKLWALVVIYTNLKQRNSGL